MKSVFFGILSVMIIGLSLPAHAQTPATTMSLAEGAEFLNKLRCSTCHAVDVDKTGPAYKKVSTRYTNPDEATKAYLKELKPADYLFKKVRSGTVLFGPNKNKNWLKNDQGVDYGMMTPNTPDIISDDDLKKMIAFVLSLSSVQ